MAPSRALKRFATSAPQAQAQLSQPLHTMRNIRSAYVRTCNHRPLSTLPARTQTTFQARSWAQRASPIRHNLRRPYSSQSADNTPDAVQPPDYLNEKELHVFNKIKAELEPVRLEVRPGDSA
jgi:hypothetical protein